MLKTLIVMLLAITAGAVGDIFLTQGMKSLGDISAMGLRQIIEHRCSRPLPTGG